VLFAYLHGTEGLIPLATFALARRDLHILYNHIREWEDGEQLPDDPDFGFPSAPCGWGDALLTVETVSKPPRASPFARPSGTSHGPPCLDGLFDVIGSFCHEVKHGLLGSNHAVALEFGTRVNANHKRLISRLLLVAELDIEEAKFVPPGPGFATLEEMTSLGRGVHGISATPRPSTTGIRIRKDFLSPGQAWVK
jgi:hypothetical protein